jgi:murein L,D-transpeptidase YcbB/YkuD
MQDASRISRRVSLLRPLTVVLFYTTAEVEADGVVRFARDIYGHDRRLDAALHSGG